MHKYARPAVIAVAVAAVAAVLVIPLPATLAAPRMARLADVGHFFLFGGLTLVFWWVLGGRLWVALAAATVVNGVCESAQSFSTRHADLNDFLRGLAGSLVVVVLLHALRREKGDSPIFADAKIGTVPAGTKIGTVPGREPLRLKRLGGHLLLAGALSVWPIGDAACHLADIFNECRHFPVLCDFQSPWQTRRWECRGAEIRRVRAPEPDGAWTGRFEFDRQSGWASFYPVFRDWSGYGQVCFDWTVIGEPLEGTLCLVTVSKGELVNTYCPLTCAPGRYRMAVRLPPSPGWNPPSGHDLSRVHSLVLSVGEIHQPRVVILHSMRLE